MQQNKNEAKHPQIQYLKVDKHLASLWSPYDLAPFIYILGR